MTTQQPGAFDPREHLINLPRKQKQPDGSWKVVENLYLETKWRLVWLHAAHPEGASIVTELVDHVAGDYAVFRAQVAVDGRTATGYAMKQAGGPISYLENAETHALGRALAALGLGTQFCDDFAEGTDDEGVTPVDAPVSLPKAASPAPSAAGSPVSASRQSMREGPPRPAVASPSSGPLPVTEPQIKAIYAIARGQHQMDDGMVAAWVQERFGCALDDLSRRQASECIDALKLGGAA